MKMFLHKTSLCSAAVATVLAVWAGSATAQSTRAIAAVEVRSAQPDTVLRTVNWRNGYGYYDRGYYGRGYGYYARPYANYYAPRARYYPRYYAPYDRGYGYPGSYYGPRYGYGYPYGAARVGPVRVFWR